MPKISEYLQLVEIFLKFYESCRKLLFLFSSLKILELVKGKMGAMRFQPNAHLIPEEKFWGSSSHWYVLYGLTNLTYCLPFIIADMVTMETSYVPCMRINLSLVLYFRCQKFIFKTNCNSLGLSGDSHSYSFIAQIYQFPGFTVPFQALPSLVCCTL